LCGQQFAKLQRRRHRNISLVAVDCSLVGRACAVDVTLLAK